MGIHRIIEGDQTIFGDKHLVSRGDRVGRNHGEAVEEEGSRPLVVVAPSLCKVRLPESYIGPDRFEGIAVTVLQYFE